jgi:acetylornithine deacetylase
VLSEIEQRVLGLIDDNTEQIVAYLRRLISYQTVTPASGGRAENDDYKDLQQFIYRTLKDMGFQLVMWEVDAGALDRFPGSGVDPTRDLSNMPVLVGTLAGAGNGQSLILNGHYDVVPPGMAENWRHAPFGGEVEGNKVFGRGACDMKGGIAAMLHAVKCIQQSGVKLRGDVIVETVPDEEMTCMGSLSCCQRGYKADAAIIPEPTDMKVLMAMRGSLYGKITVFGRAGHAETTQPHWTEGGAVNAISKAARIIEGLEALTNEWRIRPDKQHKYLDPDIIIPTVIQGGEWAVTYPEQVEIEFGAIFIPSTTNVKDEIEEHLARIAAVDPWMREHPPRLESGEWHYGAEVAEHEPIVQTTLEVLGDLGIEPTLVGCGSLTDAVHLINYAKIPTVSIGPGTKTAHMTDEFVDIGELVSTTKALALAIMRWCG